MASTADRVGLSMLANPDPSALERVQRPKRRVPARRVQREPDAASRERELRDEKQLPPVDRVGDRAAEERASEHGDDLCQANETHVQRGMGELEHLVRDRDHREL